VRWCQRLEVGCLSKQLLCWTTHVAVTVVPVSRIDRVSSCVPLTRGRHLASTRSECFGSYLRQRWSPRIRNIAQPGGTRTFVWSKGCCAFGFKKPLWFVFAELTALISVLFCSVSIVAVVNSTDQKNRSPGCCQSVKLQLARNKLATSRIRCALPWMSP